MIKQMLCNKLSLRGHKGVRNTKFSKCSYWAETWIKYACDILSIIKHTPCYRISLRGHKGVRNSKFSKCSNWAQTWLKVCIWHFKHY